MNIGIETIFDIEENTSAIQDSGDRTKFPSGSVRDMHEGKGRCDLLPLDVVKQFYEDVYYDIFYSLNEFINYGNKNYLKLALKFFTEKVYTNKETMLLELACHYEDGCKKYGVNNWKKGIPVSSYIDSAVRHLLKHIRGDQDERHDRAFCWNIVCAMWTVENKPDYMDLPFKYEEE